MIEAVLSQVAPAAAQTDAAGGGGQPTAAQVARFEQQLQSPAEGEVLHYQPPPVDGSLVSGELRRDVGHLAEQYRAESMELEGTPAGEDELLDLRSAPDPTQATEVFERGMTHLAHMSYTMMSIGFLTNTQRECVENVRTLYQMN
jgi:hypothetical protein